MQPERVRLEGYSLSDIFREEFLEKFSNEINRGSLFPVAAVFVNEYTEDEEAHAATVTLNHQSAKEVKEGTLHVDSDSPELLESVHRTLEEH